jgi:hypothetical protein
MIIRVCDTHNTSLAFMCRSRVFPCNTLVSNREWVVQGSPFSHTPELDRGRSWIKRPFLLMFRHRWAIHLLQFETVPRYPTKVSNNSPDVVTWPGKQDAERPTTRVQKSLERLFVANRRRYQSFECWVQIEEFSQGRDQSRNDGLVVCLACCQIHFFMIMPWRWLTTSAPTTTSGTPMP